MKCRHCGSEVVQTFVDLGCSPPSNALLSESELLAPEVYYPLKVMVCHACWLVQTQDFVEAHNLFEKDYVYYSSTSSSFVAHAERYVESVVERFELDGSSLVVEVAANDGYLLQFVKERGIPCLGIEPTDTGEVAREKGIEIVSEFFDETLAERLLAEGKSADLTAANNVLAHVPNINSFVGGFARILRPTGVSTFEFPHLLNLVRNRQFDQIYHEHFSYLSLLSVSNIFDANGLEIFDVEKVETHGGSLRVYAQRNDTSHRPVSASVQKVLDEELAAGMATESFYADFQEKVTKIKWDFLTFLITEKRKGAKIVGYGAAAKGCTLLNYAGIHSDLIDFVADRARAKQGKYLPGSRVPVVAEDRITELKPDYIWIVPWNLTPEIQLQLSYARDWGAKFIAAMPDLMIF